MYYCYLFFTSTYIGILFLSPRFLSLRQTRIKSQLYNDTNIILSRFPKHRIRVNVQSLTAIERKEIDDKER